MNWHKILKIEGDIIPIEHLIKYCEDRAEKYEHDFKHNYDDFPDFKGMVKGYANIYRNIAGALKHGQSNEGALQCEHCKMPFMPKNTRAKFCSNKCRTAHFRANNNH